MAGTRFRTVLVCGIICLMIMSSIGQPVVAYPTSHSASDSPAAASTNPLEQNKLTEVIPSSGNDSTPGSNNTSVTAGPRNQTVSGPNGTNVTTQSPRVISVGPNTTISTVPVGNQTPSSNGTTVVVPPTNLTKSGKNFTAKNKWAQYLGYTTVSAVLDFFKYRGFYSGDPDQDPGSSSGIGSGPEELAKVFDLAYDSTRPDMEIHSRTLFEYRRDRLQALSNGTENLSYFVDLRAASYIPKIARGYLSDSYGITDIEPNRRSRHLQVSFEFVGFHGGGRPVYKTIVDKSPDYMIGSSGAALTHLDYGISYRAVPDDHCDPTKRADGLKTQQVKVNSSTETHYVDGKQVCYSYHIETNVTRTLKIFSSGQGSPTATKSVSGIDNGAAINFTDSMTPQSGTGKIKVVANVTSKIYENKTVFDYDPKPPNSSPNGDWHLESTSTSVDGAATVVEGDEATVAFPNYNRVDINQTIINISKYRKHSIINIDRNLDPDDYAAVSKLVDGPVIVHPGSMAPHPPVYEKTKSGNVLVDKYRMIDPLDIPSYVPIASFNISEGKTVRTGWSAFTVADPVVSQVKPAARTSDPIPSPRSLQRPLTTLILMGQRRPVIDLKKTNATPSGNPYPVRIERAKAVRVFTKKKQPELPENVNLTSMRPRFYNQLVLTNINRNVSNAVSIHGDKIPFDGNPRVIPGDVPRIDIERVIAKGTDDEKVKITVTNLSGRPITNRTLDLRGATPRTVTTDDNGTVIVNQTSVVIGVRVRRDSWDNPGDRFVTQAYRSKVLPRGGTIDDLFIRLIEDGLIGILPLMMYLFVRRIWTGPTEESILERAS